jgi:hypothetical protein
LGDDALVTIKPTIEETVLAIRKLAADELVEGADGKMSPKMRIPVLVTGSLHLVGGFLEIIETGSQSEFK